MGPTSYRWQVTAPATRGSMRTFLATDPSVAICVLVADCAPICLLDPVRPACSSSSTPDGAGRRRAPSPEVAVQAAPLARCRGRCHRRDRTVHLVRTGTRSAPRWPRPCGERAAGPRGAGRHGPPPRRPRGGEPARCSSVPGSPTTGSSVTPRGDRRRRALLQRPRRAPMRSVRARGKAGAARPRSMARVGRPAPTREHLRLRARRDRCGGRDDRVPLPKSTTWGSSRSPRSTPPSTSAAPACATRPLLFLLAGLSYYKAERRGRSYSAAPRRAPTRELVDRCIDGGIAEFAYRNGLDLRDVAILGGERVARAGLARHPPSGSADPLRRRDRLDRHRRPAGRRGRRPVHRRTARRALRGHRAPCRDHGADVVRCTRSLDPLSLRRGATAGSTAMCP